MSGKLEHQDAGMGPSVLRKAVSFRNDLRLRITGKPTSVFSTDSTISKPEKKKTSVKRSGSYNDGHTDKTTDILKKLELEMKKVFQALRYIQDVVDKGILEQLQGSVTIVLEQILEFNLLIQKCCPNSNQESSLLTSAFRGLHQSVAKLTRWSDNILLGGEEVIVNKQDASDLLDAVKSSIQGLVTIAEENFKNMNCQAASLSENSSGISIVIDRNSTSEISDTLDDETDGLNTLSSTSTRSISADNILDNAHYQEQPNDRPPPKPPLPNQPLHMYKVNSLPRPLTARERADQVFETYSWQFSPREVDEIPPPLPEKKRSSGGLCELSPNPQSSRSPLSLTAPLTIPSSCSRTNSINSTFSASCEDLLIEPPPKPLRTANRRGSRSSQYDNLTEAVYESSNNFDLSDRVIKGGMSSEEFSESCPPPLPVKKNSTAGTPGICLRLGSQYDNISCESASSVFSPSSYQTDVVKNQTQLLPMSSKVVMRCPPVMKSIQDSMPIMSSKHIVMSKVTTVRKKTTMRSTISQDSFITSQATYSEVSAVETSQHPPPVPPKKHVHAYMRTFGECSSLISGDFTRHSMLLMNNICEAEYIKSQNINFVPPHFCELPFRAGSLISPCDCNSDLILALPKSSSEASKLNPPPVIPPKQRDQSSSQGTVDSGFYSLINCNMGNCEQATDEDSSLGDKYSSMSLSQKSSSECADDATPTVIAEVATSFSVPGDADSVEVNKVTNDNILEAEDAISHMIMKQPNEEGPDMRGGSVDALIVHATVSHQSPGNNSSSFLYQEAFLMTYRTFISPSDLINKLLYRYNCFSKASDVRKKKLSRNAFSLLIRVVDELCRETDEQMLHILMDLVYQLLSDGELLLARTMRKKVLEKCENYRLKQAASHRVTLLPSYQLTAKSHSITEFKSGIIAEQMTLLDAELFNKIEIPEVLLWSKEQSEEHSPNLTEFTEHFNKMSYWCRTRILEQDEPKERERHLMKFIKIMKHLRRLNNYNSYLAILSAVDSAPVRRLEWQKQNVEALKEFCQLIDSSSSFRAYRQALAETSPPCIPYIGLVLQDLTFVNIGNLDKLPDGNINFSKCWQYFTILNNMCRFKNCNYDIKKNDKVIAFFNNFDNYLSEDSLWQISEMIKPRGVKMSAKVSDS